MKRMKYALAAVLMSALALSPMLLPVEGIHEDRESGIEAQLDSVVRVCRATGFFVTPDGTILTAAHVVHDDTKIPIVLRDGTELVGRLLVADKSVDLALVQIDVAGRVKELPLAGNQPHIGDQLWVIGHPGGMCWTVTMGIASRINTDMLAQDNTVYHGILQTDASINPGNSGGPVLNSHFRVVGLVDATIMDAHCIGFCVGLETIRKFLGDNHVQRICP